MKAAPMPIPDELNDLMVRSIALEELRDKYVARPLGYRRARRAAIESGRLWERFWIGVDTLYPETHGLSLAYNRLTHVVYLAADKQEAAS